MTQGIISDKYKDSVNTLKEWLISQPHLPQNIGDAYLLKFLASCSNDMEQTQNLIDLCFTLRSKTPELFANRDPESDGLKRAFNTVDYVPLPKKTVKNYKVFVFRLRDTNPDNFIYVDVMKGFFMVADFRMSNDYDDYDGEVPIFDMAGYSLKHLTKISLSILRKYMTYTQEGHPVRLREIHVVNVPSFLDKCLTLLKPFMKREVSKAMHYHTPNSNTLYEYVPRDLLPEEYGGTLGKIDNLSSVWRKKIFDNRDFYLDDSRWNVDGAKRPTGNSNIKRTCNLEGSFKSLSID